MKRHGDITVGDLDGHHRIHPIGWSDTRGTPWIQHLNPVVGFVFDLVAVVATE